MDHPVQNFKPDTTFGFCGLTILTTELFDLVYGSVQNRTESNRAHP